MFTKSFVDKVLILTLDYLIVHNINKGKLLQETRQCLTEPWSEFTNHKILVIVCPLYWVQVKDREADYYLSALQIEYLEYLCKEKCLIAAIHLFPQAIKQVLEEQKYTYWELFPEHGYHVYQEKDVKVARWLLNKDSPTQREEMENYCASLYSASLSPTSSWQKKLLDLAFVRNLIFKPVSRLPLFEGFLEGRRQWCRYLAIASILFLAGVVTFGQLSIGIVNILKFPLEKATPEVFSYERWRQVGSTFLWQEVRDTFKKTQEPIILHRLFWQDQDYMLIVQSPSCSREKSYAISQGMTVIPLSRDKGLMKLTWRSAVQRKVP